MDIMNRLPVKSLLQFRAVSKQWKFSIDSFDFIRNYGCREINTCCFNLSFSHNTQGYIHSFDQNLGFRNFDSNLNVFSLKPVASSEGVGVGEFSPPYYISQLGDSLIISGSFGFGAFRIIYAWALDFEDDYIAIMKMAPYEAFACRCGKGDVVLRESYQPNTCGKLYYPKENDYGWKEERVRLLLSSSGSSSTPSYSSEPSSTNSYSSGSTTPQNHQSGTSISGGCSNCKHLLEKIKVLEAAVEMHMHPKQHTRNSTELLHELYIDMDNLGLE
ncbi:F-box domain containing protein [Tanacetum coccineum]